MSRDLYGKLQAKRGDDVVELGQINAFQSHQQNTDEIEQMMLQIRQNIEELDSLQRKALNAISDAENNELESQLELLTNKTNALNTKVSNKLKAMQQNFAGKPADAELQMQKNFHGALTNKFMALLNKYQEAQKKNRDACSARFARQYRIANPNATDEEIHQKLIENDTQGIFSSQILDSGRTQKAKFALQQAEDRHKDVERIGRSIIEVNQLFVDMQRMVEQQGGVLDRIEDNVNATTVHMTTATEHLETAVESSRAARRKRWCLFITFIIILIIIVIVVLVYALPSLTK